MIRGLYSAAGALQVAERNQEVVAHNLANANMPGFRRQLVTFESFNQESQPIQASPAGGAVIGAPGHRPITVFEPGAMHFTDRPLDVAIKGEGFFVVEGPNGPLYTRNGTFELDPNGVLQTTGGLSVSGGTGRITIPSGTAKIVIQDDGTVMADGNQVGQIKLAEFDDPTKLTQAGTTLYSAPTGVRPKDSQSSIQQGYRESSNVQVVDEMVRMIAGLRMYEASQRAMKSISDATQQRTLGQVQ